MLPTSCPAAFAPVVARPAYSSRAPLVAIGEAHRHFPTAGGGYRPFADLLTGDGYQVRRSTQRFSPAAWANVRVLVVVNALGAEAIGRVVAFTGQSRSVPANAIALLRMARTAVDHPSPSVGEAARDPSRALPER